MMKVNLLFNSLISAIYPNKCVCCGKIINENTYICDECDKVIERNNINNICLSCGLEEEHCVCKYNIYRFDSLICLFKNYGYARDTYYSYKFAKKQHYVNFFVDEMCKAISNKYGDIDFDIICAVPSFNSFGYNHSGYIAKSVSKNMQIPYDKKLLSCIKKTKKQHKSTFKERTRNVEGKYKAKHRIDNLKVLLIDDIKTTGATIDECSKELLFAGADSVYCITVLGSLNLHKQ